MGTLTMERLRLARILYIEDYPAAAMTLTYVMEELGHECVVAATGQAALDLYRAQAFDMVLIDNQLPDIEGPDVARALRALERESGRAPSVLLAFSAGSKGSDTYREAGMDGFAMKSLSLTDIRDLLRQYLKI